MMTPGNFEQFLPRLSSCGVKYILIGGGAAIAHGLARATYDVDIVYERSPENLAALVEAMRNSLHSSEPRVARRTSSRLQNSKLSKKKVTSP